VYRIQEVVRGGEVRGRVILYARGSDSALTVLACPFSSLHELP
jgi:hypothetical protein